MLTPTNAPSPAAAMRTAATDLDSGRPLVMIDNNHHAHLLVSAARLTTTTMAFMIRHTSGLICAPLTLARAIQLGFPPMVFGVQSGDHPENFTVAVDAVAGVTTGISAHDRAITIGMLAQSSSAPADFTRPGHVLPVITDESGVRGSESRAEGAIDLCRIAGLPAVGAIADLMCDSGEQATAAYAEKFAFEHRLAVVSVAQIVAYRVATEGPGCTCRCGHDASAS